MVSIYPISWTVLLIWVTGAVASDPANYSVQLVEGLAPAGWTAENWAAAADTMIGKTSAHILTDLIENLAIKLQVTESAVREEIDSGREALDLKPLPPPADKKGAMDFVKTRYHARDLDDDVFTYLPPGWTEEKLKTHTDEDLAALPSDVRERLTERLGYDSTSNDGYLEALPFSVGREISSNIHETTRKALGLEPGVRAYKRALAPLVAVVTLQNYDNFGFLLCRTSYKNATAWEELQDNIEMINDAQLEGDWNGEGIETIIEKFLMPVYDDEVMEGGSAEDCRAWFREFRTMEFFSYGLDVGVLLMVDEKSISSMSDFSEQNPAHVWAVDVDFNPEKNTYPAGYEGIFEVRTHALLHHLYVALASGMAPVDIWKLTLQASGASKEGQEKKHDEL